MRRATTVALAALVMLSAAFRAPADEKVPLPAGQPVLPREPANRSVPVERGGFPNRVHVFEDYETDIEKRWWLAGRLEEKNVPGGKRACRGVLTQDFDDKQGDLKTMYTAVIFNPVPGPPMGKNPRLAFRLWLKGTSTLRVQIYSLTNGYHRHLTLTDLAQEKWLDLTVDMTKVRKHDGTGGPLSEDERIDDIQFYADPRAELLIDDIVLFDAHQPDAQARENSSAREKRPFPKRVLFTGWFDTGVQGKEWPGTFEILDHKGHFWDAARSVQNGDLGGPAIRLNLRGERLLGQRTELSFRYLLSGAGSMKVRLFSTKAGEGPAIELKDLAQGKWSEATVDFTDALLRLGEAGGAAKALESVDEIHFVLPAGGELLLDDVLLFELGK
ncbi:MAG: hypothetical protein HYS13_04540 [Planctomycetia bacterium]|nr:hypothetical protein [Planctomycetia bacterium]